MKIDRLATLLLSAVCGLHLLYPLPAEADPVPHPGLVESGWTWAPEGTLPDPKLELRFRADGQVTSSTGAKWRWKSRGARSVAIEGGGGAAVLTFDAEFRHFDALGFDGKTKFKGTRKTAPVSTPPPAPAPVALAPAPAPSTPAPGIAISGIDQAFTSVLMSTGGHSHELEDVHLLLTNFGTAKKDVAPHPEAMIYPGVPYLMPWRAAEKVLAPGYTDMKSAGKIACAGFPDGLSWVAYSGKWHVHDHDYNRLYLVKDIVGQVVCIEFGHEHDSWRQPGPEWIEQQGNWRVIDYVNAEVKGQSDIRILTQIFDERSSSHRIVVHTTSKKIGRTATLFLPQPLIDLMLHCVRTATLKRRGLPGSSASSAVP
jgi:hypothetical protein